MDRCLHPEPSAADILAHLEETHAMLRQAKERRERLRAELNEAQATVERLVVETERLERALLAAARGAENGSADSHGGMEGAPEGVVALVESTYGVPSASPMTAADTVDLG